MSNKRKYLFFSVILIILTALGIWFLSCKEKQKYTETIRERYKKLGVEMDNLLKEQKEQQNIGPR